MPIPPFDGILNVLPPHLGKPGGVVEGISPYECTPIELTQRLSGTPARKEILTKFFDLRFEFFRAGITGFQWVCGSFVEDIEVQERRDPGDVDVVTFVTTAGSNAEIHKRLAHKPELLDEDYVKAHFKVDHFWLPLGSSPLMLVELTKYWYALYAHRRDKVWKGILMLPLSDPSADGPAVAHLGSLP